VGQVSFISATDGPPFANPIAANTIFLTASIKFKVVGVSNDGLADIACFFDTNDGLSDANNNFITVATFNSGFVIPEPAPVGLVFGSVALLWGIAARRPRRR